MSILSLKAKVDRYQYNKEDRFYREIEKDKNKKIERKEVFLEKAQRWQDTWNFTKTKP